MNENTGRFYKMQKADREQFLLNAQWILDLYVQKARDGLAAKAARLR